MQQCLWEWVVRSGSGVHAFGEQDDAFGLLRCLLSLILVGVLLAGLHGVGGCGG